jgi:hypothetical protein
MKTISLVLFASLFASACLDGGTSDMVEPTGGTGGKGDDITETEGELAAALPILTAPHVKFNPGPELAAVQPTATLHFSYASCAKRNWNVKKEIQPTLQGRVTMLQLEDNGVDCFGPTIVRDYVIQVSSDAAAERNFVVLNPTAMTFSNNPN